ncbi:MAG: DUF2889 domain-containing protein [Deltaproteobacteria bacterium]|nr:DUF2889 domain-containing protein [Deltaproteobacteria bacterium]
MNNKQLIHTRDITINTYEIAENTILIEGILKDIQHCPWYFYTTGEFREPGFAHHMTVEMRVSLPRLMITNIESRMPIAADNVCREVQNQIKEIIGLSVIRKGFKKKVSEILGGTRGCIHVTGLILEMSAAAIQGQWAYYNKVVDGKLVKVPEFDLSILANSCWLWRKNGPFFDKIRKVEAEVAKLKKTLEQEN